MFSGNLPFFGKTRKTQEDMNFLKDMRDKKIKIKG